MDKDKRSPPTDEEKLIEDCLPQIPEEFAELQELVVVHQSLFFDQATLLKARYDAFLCAGFNEEQALQLVLRWGLKKNLTDS